MKHFKYFWKETSSIFSLLTLCGCASIMENVEYPKASSLSLSGGQTSIQRESRADPVEIFKSYCSGGKQIKNLSISFTSILPKNPKNWPINDATKYMRVLAEETQCLNRSILYQFALAPDCQTYYGNYVKDLRGEKICASADRQNPVWFLMTDESYSAVEVKLRNVQPASPTDSHVPIFVRTSSGKIYGFQLIGNGSSSPDVIFQSKELFGPTLSTINLAEMASLIEGFTMIEPLEFQKNAYGDDPGSNLTCSGESQWQPLGLDDMENADIAEAINQKHQIWERYVKRFSKVKESSSPRDSQLTNTQVDLDLTAFCQYGRSIQDMSSK